MRLVAPIIERKTQCVYIGDYFIIVLYTSMQVSQILLNEFCICTVIYMYTHTHTYIYIYKPITILKCLKFDGLKIYLLIFS